MQIVFATTAFLLISLSSVTHAVNVGYSPAPLAEKLAVLRQLDLKMAYAEDFETPKEALEELILLGESRNFLNRVEVLQRIAASERKNPYQVFACVRFLLMLDWARDGSDSDRFRWAIEQSLNAIFAPRINQDQESVDTDLAETVLMAIAYAPDSRPKEAYTAVRAVMETWQKTHHEISDPKITSYMNLELEAAGGKLDDLQDIRVRAGKIHLMAALASVVLILGDAPTLASGVGSLTLLGTWVWTKILDRKIKKYQTADEKGGALRLAMAAVDRTADTLMRALDCPANFGPNDVKDIRMSRERMIADTLAKLPLD